MSEFGFPYVGKVMSSRDIDRVFEEMAKTAPQIGPGIYSFSSGGAASPSSPEMDARIQQSVDRVSNLLCSDLGASR